MIHEMVFDPTELRTVGTVFDEAWEALRAQHAERYEPRRDTSSARISSWCFEHWQVIINSASSRSQRWPFGCWPTTI